MVSKVVVPRSVAVEYTGTPESAAEVIATITGTITATDVWTLVSSDPDKVTLHYVVVGQYEQDMEYPLGWIICGPKGPSVSYPDEAALDAVWFTVADGGA